MRQEKLIYNFAQAVYIVPKALYWNFRPCKTIILKQKRDHTKYFFWEAKISQQRIPPSIFFEP